MEAALHTSMHRVTLEVTCAKQTEVGTEVCILPYSVCHMHALPLEHIWALPEVAQCGVNLRASVTMWLRH